MRLAISSTEMSGSRKSAFAALMSSSVQTCGLPPVRPLALAAGLVGAQLTGELDALVASTDLLFYELNFLSVRSSIAVALERTKIQTIQRLDYQAYEYQSVFPF